MQEFRRPDWCAYQMSTEKVLTGLSEDNLLLLATVLAGDEIEDFYVLSKSSNEWKKFEDEKSLHRPLDFKRGVTPPELNKVKGGGGNLPSANPPMPPPQQPVFPGPAPEPVELPAEGATWSLCFVALGRVVTELTIQEILLIATTFHPAELQYVWVLNRNFSKWKNIQNEPSLRIPLQFQRNVQTVSLQKVKPIGRAETQTPPAPPVEVQTTSQESDFELEVPTKVDEKPQTVVRKPRFKIAAQIFGPMAWRGEVTGVHWPLLVFDREIQGIFQFFQIQVTLGSEMYLLSAYRGDQIRENLPNSAMVLITQEAVQFEEALESLEIK